jgi:copper(I)-binding protein
MTKLKKISLALVALLGLAAPAMAQAPQASPIKIEQAWARSTPPVAKTAAAYMTIVNTGHEDDTLLSASTPVAGMADVHHSFLENGIEKMRPAGPLDLKPGASLKLSPGGYHVMLMDLKGPLTAGQTFPVTLVFKKAGNVTAVVHVQKAGAGGSMGDMNMGGMKNMGGMSGH